MGGPLTAQSCPWTLAEIALKLKDERDALKSELALVKAMNDEAARHFSDSCLRDMAFGQLQSELATAKADTARLESFLALAMYNFDGMARGQLWEQYRKQFPGLHERAIESAMNPTRNDFAT